MYGRLLLSLVLLASLWLAWRALQRWQLRRAGRAYAHHANPRGPAVIYFWSPECAVCRSAQKPILGRLSDVRVISHNVHEDPELARAWGVTSVPTTFVIDVMNRPCHVNNGLVSESRLRQQLGLAGHA